MNAYQRPGYSNVSTPERHLLQVVSSCHPLAAHVLAAEDRQSSAVSRAEQIRWRRESRAASGSQSDAPAWLRQTIGSALVRLGQRLEGASTTMGATGTAV